MEITKATSDDIIGIYDLLVEIFSGLGDYYGTRWTKQAEKCVKKWLTFVAKDNGKVIGFLSCRQLKNGTTAQIEWFGVAELYRNKGVGTDMMKQLIKGLTELKFKKILIRASNWDEYKESSWRRINHGDTRAVKFYRRFGFRYRKGWMAKVIK